MDVTRLVVVRHGETAWNADARIQGHTDIGLNDTGRWQAAQMAAALAGEAIDAVYSSDLARALDTARALATATGAPLVADAGLRERAFGIFEGLSFAEIEARWPDQALRWRQRDPAYGPDGGETLAAFFSRCTGAALRLARAHPGQSVAIVAHGGVLDCLYRAATRIGLAEPRTWQVGNATINRLLLAGDRFTMVGWNDARHLDAAPRDEIDTANGGR
jgi:probable phosphoglycerate mutase